jgi:hypothetical protein
MIPEKETELSDTTPFHLISDRFYFQTSEEISLIHRFHPQVRNKKSQSLDQPFQISL